jgi:glycerophosphoryl diester phosphodiesterase
MTTISRDRVKIIGHRGWSARFPDNTLAGIEAAIGVADMVETDVRRTGDGRLVLSHDPELGGHLVSATPWSRLREMDLGGGLHPLLLEDLLTAVPTLPLNLEVKNSPAQPGFEPDHALALETAALARDRDLLTCFYWPSVDAVRQTDSKVATGLLLDEGGSIEDAIAHALRQGHRVVVPHFALALGEIEAVGRARAAGLEVSVWTVNDPSVARKLVDAGVTGIITDDPGLMRAELGEGR